MEAYITHPDPASFSDPLTRLLAAILEWLRALLAEHQASQANLRPCAPAFSRKTAEPAMAPLRAVTPAAPAHAVTPEARLRDSTAGLPRPRLVAPS